MSKNSISGKPIKGQVLNIEYANINTLNVNNITNLQSLINGNSYSDISITNSSIDNTVIGFNTSADGYFNTLFANNNTYLNGDVRFSGTGNANINSLYWNSAYGELDINAYMVVYQNVDINGILNMNDFNISNINTLSGFNNVLNISSGNINLYGNINFGNTSSNSKITADTSHLNLYGNSIDINSNSVSINGNLNVLGSINAMTTTYDTNAYILQLGTQEILNITNITNSVSSGNVVISTSPFNNYLSVGDLVNITQSSSFPSIDGNYIVNSIVDNTSFTIPFSQPLNSNGTSGSLKTDLKTYQGKDVGIEVMYWSTVGNTSITAGSSNFKTGFFGWINNDQTWKFYNTATVNNNVVISGNLGDIQINQLYANKLSSIELTGTLSTGNYSVLGSNFIINGGSIDNTPIGQTTPNIGKFTDLTISNNITYSIDRINLNTLTTSINPDISKIISYISISGNNLNTFGTMSNISISDGQIKKIIMTTMGNSSTYTLYFGSGLLYTPNPLNSTLPTQLLFKYTGQSCELVFNSALNAWFLNGGTGCIVI